MDSFQIRKVALTVPFPVAVVTRPRLGRSDNSSASGHQTLVFSNDRDALFGTLENSGGSSSVYELLSDGNDAGGSFRLGARAVKLKERGPDGQLKPYMCHVALHRAVYDPYTMAVYFVEGRALMRLDADDVVSPLAGHKELPGATDGPGPTARFQLPHSLVSDGSGGLYVADASSIRRVTLPGPEAPPETPAMVSTVYGGPWSAGFVDVAYDMTRGRLYAATMSAVFRLSGPSGSAPTCVAGCEPGTGAHTLAAGGGAGAGGPWLGVGEGMAAAGVGGCGTSGSCSRLRRFEGISGLVGDGEGGLLVADRQQVYRLEAEGGPGAALCLAKSDTSWGAVGCYPTTLPNGWLALCQYADRRLLLLHPGLGLRPWGPLTHGALLGGRPIGLHHEGVTGLLADLGALLTCPDGWDDVEVAVGDRSFRCHRLILAARCPYFRRLFAGGFVDSGARRVVLQDACPDAFALLLRHMYTGDLAFPAALLRATAELADRLLLSQVATSIQRRLLSAVTPATVVGDLLWAHKMGFEGLLAGLKEWYLDNQAAVLAAAPDAVRELFTATPALMYELHCATVRQVSGVPAFSRR